MDLKIRFFTSFLLLFGVLFLSGEEVFSAPGLLGEAGGANDHPHNLSSSSTNAIKSATEDQICIFCHTPHGGSMSGPLWNRADPAGPFPLYDDTNGPGTINIDSIGAADYSTASPAGYPNGSSRLCMSCHDGVTAVGQVIVGGNLGAMTMSAYGTIDLSSSHPISFVYDATVVAALPAGFSLPPGASVVNVDGNNRVQCTTCHDPHLDTKEGIYGNPMWRLYTGDSNTNADYDNTCLVCHTGVPEPSGSGGQH